MCGILGYVGGRRASDVLLEGLKRLEYRGYDSAGVAVLNDRGFQLRRSVGKLGGLESLLKKKPAEGHLGIGHTRWATHGVPSEDNAHPHMDASKKLVIVHNGIIENYVTLKEKLISKGYVFKSETDTEVIVHLIHSYWDPLLRKPSLDSEKTLLHAIRQALSDVKGTYALGIVCAANPGTIIGARRDCPLIIGVGKNENFLASDVPAVLSYTRDIIFLEDGDLAVLRRDGVTLINESETVVKRPKTRISWNPAQAEKAGYRHFMLKEIYEQPRVVEDTLLGRLHTENGNVTLDELRLNASTARKIRKIRFVGCGTSWHAALVGSFLLEKYAGIPTQVDIASEFRYRDPILEPNTLVVAVSQSGETADTLAAARLAKKKGARVIAIANVVGSSLTREAHGSLMTHCGPEIGVASTKAFLGQLVAMHLLTLALARLRRSYPPKDLRTLGRYFAHLSQWVRKTLACDRQVAAIARKYFRHTNFLFLGRNLNYPIALEGALKLKEISYIHAEGYPAGEMKHGPIALIDRHMPIVAIATKSAVYEKMLSNIEEAKSRGASVIAIATAGDKHVKANAAHVVYVPDVPEELSPIINVIPLQILAYQIALMRGCDVDQPRNLAKSVTVE